MSKDKLDRYSMLVYLEDHVDNNSTTKKYVLFLINISKVISKPIEDIGRLSEEMKEMIRTIKNNGETLEKDSPLYKLFQTHTKNLDEILNEKNKPLNQYKKILQENLRYINLKTNQKYLKTISDNIIKSTQDNVFVGNNIIRNESIKKICFCSHSNEDKLYTIGLYLYFYQKYKIVMYFYWMHEVFDYGGTGLKRHFNNMINQSDYFVFIRTIYSELKINGDSFNYLSIKQWCAWELGNFYNEDTSGFYINAFDNNLQIKNKLLDDFIFLEDIDSQML